MSLPQISSAASQTFTTNTLTSVNLEPPTTFCFGDGDKVISISFKGGILKIESDMPMDESAKLFFEHVKYYVDDYVKSIMPHDNLKYLEWCANEGRNHVK